MTEQCDHEEGSRRHMYHRSDPTCTSGLKILAVILSILFQLDLNDPLSEHLSGPHFGIKSLCCEVGADFQKKNVGG